MTDVGPSIVRRVQQLQNHYCRACNDSLRQNKKQKIKRSEKYVLHNIKAALKNYKIYVLKSHKILSDSYQETKDQVTNKRKSNIAYGIDPTNC